MCFSKSYSNEMFTGVAFPPNYMMRSTPSEDVHKQGHLKSEGDISRLLCQDGVVKHKRGC